MCSVSIPQQAQSNLLNGVAFVSLFDIGHTCEDGAADTAA